MERFTKIHRGWLIAFACMLMATATSLLSAGISTSLAGLKTTFGLSGTLTSSIMTVRSLSAFLVMFGADWYFKKLGLRWGMAGAMVCGALSFVLFAVGNGRIWVYYAAAAAGGITYAYGLMLSASMLIKRWFNRRRGLALSIASAGTGLCSIIGAPVIQSIIDRSGIRQAFFLQSAFFLAVCVLLLTVVADDPARVGLAPVGGNEAAEGHKARRSAAAEKTLPRKWIFMLVSATCLIGICSSPAASHLTLNFTTNGFDTMQVAKAVSLYGFVLFFCKLLYGVMTDRCGAITTLWVYGIVNVAAKALCFAVAYMAGAPVLFFTAALFGMGVPIETLGYPNWCADLTRSEDYPTVLKKLQMGYQLGSLVGSALPGILYDAAGSYGWFYLICAALLAVAFGTVGVAYRKFARSAGREN